MASMEMSKTYQYRKVMKPMLERKRRARINKCLDELKDLMVTTLESEGEHVTRLEKADILELTVAHLQKLRHHRNIVGKNIPTQAEGFRSGYIYAANEVSRTLAQYPRANATLGTKLMSYLGQRLNQIQPAVKLIVPPTSDIKSISDDHSNWKLSASSSAILSPISAKSLSIEVSNYCDQDNDNLWRPW